MAVTSTVNDEIVLVKAALVALGTVCQDEMLAKTLDGSIAEPNDWFAARDAVLKYLDTMNPVATP